MFVPAAILAASLLAATASSQAQERIDGTDPQAIADLVRGYGSARLDVAGDNTPMIRGRIEGTSFVIYFYDCDDLDANCNTVSFAAGWEVSGLTVEQVNAWNRDKRFGRAYLDTEGEPVLEMDVNLKGSVSAENFEDTVDWWRVVMADFTSNVVKAAPGTPEPEEPSGEMRL
ncbi:YbjN domain-containing protein [Aureimonas populi]|uniref:YbjN domain-containing protein n=1 Tax=Aureimonas populi TaxID=1701758 RepID=A0ABW5CL74_9HYPH|nr:YbjN domain-containing protein [Aureimonas populi]